MRRGRSNTDLLFSIAKGKFQPPQLKEVIELFIDSGVDVNVKDKDGNTALHEAAIKGYLDIVRWLIGNGADVNVENSDGGDTALHLAALHGHTDVVKVLIWNGADLNDKHNGYTALHYAASCGYVEIVKDLLENGADLNAKDEDGCSAFDLAVSYRHVEVRNLFFIIDYLEKGDANRHNLDALPEGDEYTDQGEIHTAKKYYSTNKNSIDLLMERRCEIQARLFVDQQVHNKTCDFKGVKKVLRSYIGKVLDECVSFIREENGLIKSSDECISPIREESGLFKSSLTYLALVKLKETGDDSELTEDHLKEEYDSIDLEKRTALLKSQKIIFRLRDALNLM